MRKASLLATATLSLLTACGGNDVGFYTRGSLNASVHSPGEATTETGFVFNDSFRIDPASSNGYAGICQVGPTERRLRLTRVDSNALGLREVEVILPSWEAAPNTCPAGSVRLDIGGTTFRSHINCPEEPSNCTAQATRRGSYAMDLTVSCTGLAVEGDARTVDFSGTVNLDECDGPETR